ncbi:MAG: FAD-dependent hydroxylase [Burkholderiales bacterium]|nr:MAG: FAD-dependent hydroxylase [Burkholderiales bacterium]
MDFDLLVVGAGPAGLCLARSLRHSGLSVALVDPQDRDTLANPPFDGREIALTQRSASHLRDLGIWPRLGDGHISALRDALVLDGHPSARQARMRIGHELSPCSELGFLVGNHHIRRAAWQASFDTCEPGQAPTLLHGRRVVHIHTDAREARAVLDDGRTLTARLAVAADSRHSTTRRAMGIGADLHDYGRTMLVCPMTHDGDHQQTAWEWFDHGQTLALLPMNPCPQTGHHRSSVVLTLPARDIDPLMALPGAAFGEAMTQRFARQLGAMRLAGTRHTYPLVGVWPHALVGRRFAAIGDAAVGMHPVTAHGFNLGLHSVQALSDMLLQAHRLGADIADPGGLARYERRHRSASRGLYFATHAVASLYTREQPPARLLRHALVQLGERFVPFKRAVAASLTGLA